MGWKKLTRLEGGDITSSGGGVNHCGQWAGTILVDLVEVHGESSVVSGRWETRYGSCSRCGLDTSLHGTSWSRGSTGCGSTLAEESAGQHLLVSLTSSNGGTAVSVSAHEQRNHLGGIDGSSRGAAKSGCLACANLVAPDDGCIGFSSTEGGGAVTGSSISN